MPTTLTLDLGLDFARPLPGEAERRLGVGRESTPQASAVEHDARRRGCRHEPDQNARPTLDEVIVAAWEDLQARRAAACPVCGGRMVARPGAGARPAGGRCGNCASTVA
jgi:hypothetical protein